MSTKNSSGRSISLLIGAWFVCKEILNIFVGGGINFVYLLFAVLALVLGYLGIKYTNYAVAVIAVVIVAVNLLGNIKGLFSIDSMIRSLIYLGEAFVDVICALVLCMAASVREHFSNSISDITGGQ
ncbi:MAG: hypothetical protein ACI4JB_00615 [Porcipelethomonas sp.]